MMPSIHTAVSSSPPQGQVGGRRLLGTLGSGASRRIGAASAEPQPITHVPLVEFRLANAGPHKPDYRRRSL